MQDAEFKQLRTQVFEMYGRGAYEEALALIEEKWEAFPDFESDLFFWRACLAGRLGDGAGAIDALRQAAERGHWYHERMLRDPDLDLIRSSEELAELQRLFQERYERAQAEARPRREVWEPHGSLQGLLVALHGAGGSILTEGHYWRSAVDLGWRVAALQSSQVMGPGRYHWQDADKATEELQQHLAAIGEALLTVLAGFSMGAGVAIRAVLSGTVPARGFLAVAPSIRMEQMTPLIAAAPRDLRGYIVVGTEDGWSYGPATQLAAALRGAGLECSVEKVEGLDHDYPADFAASLERGLAFLQK